MLPLQKPKMCGNGLAACSRSSGSSRKGQSDGACWLSAGFSKVLQERDELRKELAKFQAEKVQGSRILQRWEGQWLLDSTEHEMLCTPKNRKDALVIMAQ